MSTKDNRLIFLIHKELLLMIKRTATCRQMSKRDVQTGMQREMQIALSHMRKCSVTYRETIEGRAELPFQKSDYGKTREDYW